MYSLVSKPPVFFKVTHRFSVRNFEKYRKLGCEVTVDYQLELEKRYWFYVEPGHTNPNKTIIKVIKFAKKHKYTLFNAVPSLWYVATVITISWKCI